jgi:hypothetical protein
LPAARIFASAIISRIGVSQVETLILKGIIAKTRLGRKINDQVFWGWKKLCILQRYAPLIKLYESSRLHIPFKKSNFFSDI